MSVEQINDHQYKKQYRTIHAKNLSDFPDLNIAQTFTESALKLICERTELPIDMCENKQCIEEKSHKTRPLVSSIEELIIYKELDKN